MVKTSEVYDLNPVEVGLSQVSFQDLRLLCIVHYMRNVSSASRITGASQPSISYSLQKMRAAFGDKLFVREKGEMAPTARCDEIVALANDVLEGFSGMVESEDEEPATTRRTFILLTRSNSSRVMSRIAQRFFKEAPNARFEVRLTADDDVNGHLSRYADVFFGAPMRSVPGIDSYESPEQPVQMIFDPEQISPPTTAEAFLSHRFAIYWQRSLYMPQNRLVDAALKSMGLPRRDVAFSSLDQTRIADVVRGSKMIYTGSPLCLPDCFQGLAHAPLPFETQNFQFGLRWDRRRMAGPLQRWFVRLVCSEVARLYESNRSETVTTPYESLA